MPGLSRPPLLGETITQERWLFEIRNAQAFKRSTNLAAAVGALGHVQLFNPVTSGIFIYVFKIISTINLSTSAETFEVAFHNTALTTLVGTGFNLDSGNTASVGEIRTQTNAVALGANLLESILHANNGANSFFLDWFARLGPGEGILSRNQTANTINLTSFSWIELVA